MLVADLADLTDAMNEAPISQFHIKAIFTSGMGFFTDAYDLFIIGTASALITKEWHLDTTQTGLINSMTLLGAFVGAIAYGRLADRLGRKKIYGLEAAIMLVFALASAFSPSVVWLIVFRFILGLGVGGDYPVSAVLMSEYSNRKNRGRLVGSVFALQALGTVVGYMAGLTLLSSGISHDYVWRILLALGAIPSAMVLYSRRRMPESPRYQARVEGKQAAAARSLSAYSGGTLDVSPFGVAPRRLTFRAFISNRRFLLSLVGTAGTWFVFDYAYYGNSVSAPLIVETVLGKGATTEQALAFNLIVFTVAAVPGYILAAAFMDRIGHKRLQMIGFPLMGLAFLLIGVVPGVTVAIVPFLMLFGVSYFFAEFGPNTTTFVLAAECFPTSARTTGHGISAGVAKLGAFIGVYAFPHISKAFGISGALEFSAGMALVGLLGTLLIPETSQRSLEDISDEDRVVAEAQRIVASPPLPSSSANPRSVP
jgi:PHS family inorganic phosphate transporter-like MFS transporter